MFSYKSFTILAVAFMSDHSELNFVYGCKIEVSYHSFTCGYPVVSVTFLVEVA